MRSILVIFSVAAFIFSAASAQAENEYADQMRKTFAEHVAPWLGDAVLIDAIKLQNAKHANLTPVDIDRLDKEWRAEVKKGSGPVTASVLDTPVSRWLKDKRGASKGMITEIFVMDNKGLNVAQADLTSDYMQGDEAKWQKTFSAGPGAMFIDEVDYDQSAERFQAQISATVTDPASGQPIGAITVGMDVEKL